MPFDVADWNVTVLRKRAADKAKVSRTQSEVNAARRVSIYFIVQKPWNVSCFSSKDGDPYIHDDSAINIEEIAQ